MNVKIYGIQKLTLLDFPGHLAAVLFLGGCSFRCPFCQNGPLVLDLSSSDPLDPEEVFSFLRKRAGILEGVCVSGGEPTLHRDLPLLFQKLKEMGYLTKLDTNGTNPEMLGELLRENLLDYAAMDIKGGRKNYLKIAGLENPGGEALLKKVFQSARLLIESRIDFEFRTTAVKGLHTEEDFLDIIQWLSGDFPYYLQTFQDCEGVLQKNHSFRAFSYEEMERFRSLVRKKIPRVQLRGIEENKKNSLQI